MNDSPSARILITAFSLSLVAPSCKTIAKVNALLDEATETARKAGDVADNVPNMVNDATMAATDAVTQSAASLGGVPAMAARFTGGTDLGRSSEGRGGSLTEDVDGDGTEEDVLVFVDDRDETFLAFELTYQEGAEQGRDCYTSWDEPDGVWLVVTECGDHPQGELVDVCAWDHDGDGLACVGLTCAGDDCELDLCYDEDGEIPCEIDEADDGVAGEDAAPDDDGADDGDTDGETDGDTGGDAGGAICEDAAALVVDAYLECGFFEPGLDCSLDGEAIESCADALEVASDACDFLDGEDGLELCPWE